VPVKSLEEELVILLRWICLNCGFCSIPDDDYRKITKSKRLEAGEFALAILRAEGFDPPEAELEWMRRLKARFIEYFGRAVVSEEEFSDEDSSAAQN
jgi:hypothetical protein